MKIYDRIVIGLGGVGSATLFELARRGLRTLGIDQFPIGHDRGSSHGQTRIIRQAYFENPAYVPLLKRADQMWCELQEQSGIRLFERVGLVEIGPEDGVVLPGVKQSADLHQLPIEWLDATDVARRYPDFAVPEGMRAVFEPTAGLLHVERCVETHARRAEALGAEMAIDQNVTRLEELHDGIIVHTNRSRYQTQGVVICAGAWSAALQLADLPLRVVRKHLHWFQTGQQSMHVDARCPVFFYELPEGFFYGFPAIDSTGIKLAEHGTGETITDPSHVDRQIDPTDEMRIHRFREQCLPHVSGTRLRHAVCMYTLTPDEHFIVDHHPRLSRTVFAAGMSGHGFKFAPVLAEVLADLSLEQNTPWDIDFLNAHRF